MDEPLTFEHSWAPTVQIKREFQRFRKVRPMTRRTGSTTDQDDSWLAKAGLRRLASQFGHHFLTKYKIFGRQIFPIYTAKCQIFGCSIWPTREAKWKHMHPRWVVPLSWPWTITCICRFSPVTRMKSLMSAWSIDLPRHHSVSAAWDGEGAGTPGREEQESWNTLFEGSQVAQKVNKVCR